MLQSYKELIVWQRSIEVVKAVYVLTEKLPKTETYGLMNQMRRSAVSIPSNIAEGYKRNNVREYIQFLGIATGSAAELDTQLVIAHEVYNVVNIEQSQSLLCEVQKMLDALKRKIKANVT